MTYRIAKEAVQKILHDNSLGRFKVLGRQLQNKSATDAYNNIVQVFYTDGDFPKSASGRGNKQHDITLNIDLTTSAGATGDVSVLNNPVATPQQKALAISSIKSATQVADEKMDDLIEAVFEIMTDARNYDLGLEPGVIRSPWIGSLRKDTTIEFGSLVVRTAQFVFTARVTEQVQGETGNKPETTIINSTTQFGDTSGAGVIVENQNT